MLDNLRKLGRTWIGKVVGAFLLVGLAGFGISNVLLDFGGDTVARVGDEEITTRDFQRAYNDDLNQFAQQIGRVPSPEEALSMGLPSGTLNRLASTAAINRLAATMDLGVSEDRLSRMLREDPSFTGTLGQFDPGAFSEVLRRSGFTEAEYFELQTKAARRNQMFAGLFADSPAPAAAHELVARFSGDTRTIDYFVINPALLPPVTEPTEAELAAYLTEHQDEFRTEEQRTIELLVLTLDTLAAAQQVTDEEIAAEYERTRASRVRPEKRTIVQAPLTAEQQATFESGLAAGRGFDELVAETGATVTDLGTLARSEVTDAALAAAAFGLETGDFVVIPGIGGSRAVSVTAIEPGGETTLEAAREEIARSLRLAKARSAYVDVLDQIEELRAAFQPLNQIAERFGLQTVEVTLEADGTALTGPDITAEQRTRIATEVFAAQQGDLTSTIAFSANNNVWFDLKAIEPARDQTIDEVRDAVHAAIIEQRTDEAVTAEVEGILERLRAGEDFADVAASLNLFPSLSQPLTRSGDGTPILDQNVASAAFGGGEGHFGAAVNGDGDQVIFQVVEIQPATATASLEQMRAYVEDTTRQSLYTDFIIGLRNEAGVRVNQQTLNQLLALDTAGQ